MRQSVLCTLLLLLLAFPAGAAEPIKIGGLFDLTGLRTSIGEPTRLVALMAVDKINKEGGIGGRPIELVVADGESEPAKAAVMLKKLLTVDRVVALIGPNGTDSGMAMKKQIEAAQIPIVMTVGGDPVIMEGKVGDMDFGTARYVFKSPQRSATAVRKVLGHLKAKGLTRLGLLSAGDLFGQDGEKLLKKLAPDMGLEIVGAEQFKPGDVDMKTQLIALAGKQPQAIVCWTTGPAGAIVSKNHHALGLAMPLMQCHGQPDPKYIELAGEAAEGDLMPATKLLTWQHLPDTDPQKKVIAEFVKLYTDVYQYDRKYPINTHSGYAWDALMLLTEALRKAGAEPGKVREAIEQTKGLVGISGIYNLSPQDHNGLDESSMVMLEVKGGKFVPAQ